MRSTYNSNNLYCICQKFASQFVSSPNQLHWVHGQFIFASRLTGRLRDSATIAAAVGIRSRLRGAPDPRRGSATAPASGIASTPIARRPYRGSRAGAARRPGSFWPIAAPTKRDTILRANRFRLQSVLGADFRPRPWAGRKRRGPAPQWCDFEQRCLSTGRR